MGEYLTPEITLAQRQSLPLEAKILMTKARIRTWYEFWEGNVHISLSGGKDSRVLADIVWSMYPDVIAAFSNTGLEYPEVVKYVLGLKESGYPIEVLRPKKSFLEVIKEFGYPVVSKKVSRMLRILQGHKDDPAWANTYRLYDTGIKMDGSLSKVSRLPDKWRHLVTADFKATELCCDHLKKEPLKTWQKANGLRPITGVMAEEGGQRANQIKHCNTFDGGNPISHPMFFWTEQDVLEYIVQHELEIPSVYGNIVRGEDGLLMCTGEKRTGCMYCMFGVHLERGENRFQRMAKTHPKQYDYCINKLGMGKILDMLGVDYKPKNDLVQIGAAS